MAASSPIASSASVVRQKIAVSTGKGDRGQLRPYAELLQYCADL